MLRWCETDSDLRTCIKGKLQLEDCSCLPESGVKNILTRTLPVPTSVRADSIIGLYHHHHHPPPPPTENFFWSQMKGMGKRKFFYSGTMVLILPRLKDIVNFVCSATSNKTAIKWHSRCPTCKFEVSLESTA